MNKKTTIILLGVFFLGMALIIISQMGKGDDKKLATQQAEKGDKFEVKKPIAVEPGKPPTPAAPSAPGAPASPGQSASQSQPAPAAPAAPAIPAAPAPAPPAAAVPTAPAAPQASAPAQPEPKPVVTAPEMKAPAQPESKPSPPEPKPVAPAPEKKAPPAPPEPKVQAVKTPPAKAAEPEKAQPAKTSEQAPAAASSGLNAIKQISVAASGEGVVITIMTSRPIEKYVHFSLGSPSRLIVDLSGKWRMFTGSASVTQNAVVKDVRVGMHPDKLRIVADCLGKAPSNVKIVRTSEHTLTIQLR